MTGAPRQLRSLSFGEVDGSLWGGALDVGSAALVAGDGAGATTRLAIEPGGWSTAEGIWGIAGPAVDLRVEPVSEERESFPPQESRAVRGVQELCRVRGAMTLSGTERRIDCVGIRSEIDGLDAGALQSLRAVAGWFDADEAFTLLALRAPRSPGQESDLVAATLFDPEGWVPVQDPRLSTTYDGAGQPTRVTLELWVGDGENEFPRRAAGEATAPAAALAGEGLEIRAVPLRCHSRGREGAGVYLLATV